MTHAVLDERLDPSEHRRCAVRVWTDEGCVDMPATRHDLSVYADGCG